MFLCLYIKFALCYQVHYSLDLLEFVWRHQTLFINVSLYIYKNLCIGQLQLRSGFIPSLLRPLNHSVHIPHISQYVSAGPDNGTNLLMLSRALYMQLFIVCLYLYIYLCYIVFLYLCDKEPKALIRSSSTLNPNLTSICGMSRNKSNPWRPHPSTQRT